MENKDKLTIGVIFGGKSAEHDISIITGQLAISALRGEGHRVFPIYISPEGEWLCGDELGKMGTFTAEDQSFRTNGKFKKYSVKLHHKAGKLGLRGGWWGISKHIELDLLFPALHGTFGEDGAFAGFAEFLGVPYVGCGISASAIAMDKAHTKEVIHAAGLPTIPWTVVLKDEWQHRKEEALARVHKNHPGAVFVKPVHLGSSIGISKVKDISSGDLADKLDVAFAYDEKVLVEDAVSDVMDTTCCVLGHKNIRASEIQESLYHTDLFDFEAKYLDGGGAQTGNAKESLVIPARLDAETTQNIKAAALKAFQAVGASGIARVDIIYDRTSKKFYVIEINPLPGTLYHHLWEKSGLKLPELLRILIASAFEREEGREDIHWSFGSRVLSSLGGLKLKSGKMGKK